jgi:protein-tyrosine phosphatase
MGFAVERGTGSYVLETGFVDIHAHVLPGLDDGPVTLDESLALLRAAANCGIATLAATPHLRSDYPGVRLRELGDRVHALRVQAERESIGVRLVSGAEVSLVWAIEAEEEELVLASYGQRGKDLLVETPDAVVAGFGHLLFRPRSRGLRVTLAHPERSHEFQRDPSRLEELVQRGVLLQVDAAALIERRRSPTHHLAVRLCRDGLAHVLASDAHRADSWRPVSALAQAFEAAAELVGRPRAEWMVREAPAAVLAGTALPDPPPVVYGRRRFQAGRRFRHRW